MHYLGFKQGGLCLYVGSAECPGDETVFVFDDGGRERQVCATCLVRFLTERGTALGREEPEEWIALVDPPPAEPGAEP
jgi:hypothetical protein